MFTSSNALALDWSLNQAGITLSVCTAPRDVQVFLEDLQRNSQSQNKTQSWVTV